MRVAPMTSRFLDACRRRPTDVRPVWFMRQAGRYMKQYREIRAKHGILEICKRPDLAATVTLQPVEILDVDAAIIFADLLLPVEPMGLKLRFAAGEGPIIDNPVRTSDDVDSLSTANTDDLGYVGEAIQQVVRALAGKVPVIGFVGAPFTLASYMIEGGASRNFIRTKRMMYSDETLWRRLMGKIVDVLAPFASLQVAAGRARHPGVRQLGGRARSGRLRALRRALFARADRAHPLHRRAGDSLRHRRFRLLPRTARRRRRRDGRATGASTSTRPGWTSATARRFRAIWIRWRCSRRCPSCARKVHELLKRTGTRPGHIFNLGHGILPETPVENVKAVVEMVREFRP